MKHINLRYFYQVGRTGSISAAAERLNVAASAVSRQISILEEEIGAALFQRQIRGMELTPAGNILMTFARRYYLDLEQVLVEVKETNNQEKSVVTVACSEGFSWNFLPLVVTHFRRNYPRINFKVHVLNAIEASKMVIEGDADIAITYSLAQINELAIAYHDPAPLFALMRNDHPLARRNSLTLSDLQSYPLALPGEGTTVRHLLDIACSLRNLNLSAVFSCHSMQSIYRYTQLSENTIALGSFFTIHSRALEDQMCLIPLAEPELHQRILQVQTMAGRKLPPAVAAFKDFLVGELCHLKSQQEMRAI